MVEEPYLLGSFVYKELYCILVAKIIAPLSCVKTMQFYRISILAREEYTRYSSFSRYRVASHRMKLGYKCYLERAFRDPCCLKRSSHASQTASYYDNVEIENLHRQIGLIDKVYILFCSNLLIAGSLLFLYQLFCNFCQSNHIAALSHVYWQSGVRVITYSEYRTYYALIHQHAPIFQLQLYPVVFTFSFKVYQLSTLRHHRCAQTDTL